MSKKHPLPQSPVHFEEKDNKQDNKGKPNGPQQQQTKKDPEEVVLSQVFAAVSGNPMRLKMHRAMLPANEVQGEIYIKRQLDWNLMSEDEANTLRSERGWSTAKLP